MTHNALYRFYTDDGRLLYVGITADPAQRFGKHAATKAWWPEVRGISLEWYDDREDVLAAERRAIAVEGPLWNLQRAPMRAARPKNCGHCVYCLHDEPCAIAAPDNYADPIACPICSSETCLYGVGYEDGHQHGWSRAHERYSREG